MTDNIDLEVSCSSNNRTMNNEPHPSLYMLTPGRAAWKWAGRCMDSSKAPNSCVKAPLTLYRYPSAFTFQLNQVPSLHQQTVFSPEKIKPRNGKILPVKKKVSCAKLVIAKHPVLSVSPEYQNSIWSNLEATASSLHLMPSAARISAHASNGLPRPALKPDNHQCHRSQTTMATTSTKKHAKPKRKANKCTAEGCKNTVVQGGVCLQHGAKRKQCKHPGCTKNVKQAGMCSAHGPARKRCETLGCKNIAVQGGVCISHGAKQKICSFTQCTKKSKVKFGNLCKHHFDLTNQQLICYSRMHGKERIFA